MNYVYMFMYVYVYVCKYVCPSVWLSKHAHIAAMLR